MITSNIELIKIADKLKIPSFFVCSKDELKSNTIYKNYILNMSKFSGTARTQGARALRQV